MAATNKLREELAEKFLAALNQGQLPWSACWSTGRPENAVTGKVYRGVNALSLSCAADDRGFTDPRWCTYNQAQEKGWQVRKGAKAARVEYWAYYDTREKKLLQWRQVRDKLKADPEYEKHLQLRCRIYSVFNARQMDAIRYAQDSGLDEAQIGVLAQPHFLPIQMDIIRNGFLWGMTVEQVQSFARPGITPQEMLQASKAIRGELTAEETSLLQQLDGKPLREQDVQAPAAEPDVSVPIADGLSLTLGG